MTVANNVTRMLDAQGVRYALFSLPPEKLGALEVAALLHVPADVVFKTIVVACEPPRKPLLALVSGTSVVDLKKVATALGEKKVRLPTEREAEALTGLQAGGISPLALTHKRFRVLIDNAARRFSDIHVSGGQRGTNIRLSVDDLARVTGARFADLSRPG